MNLTLFLSGDVMTGRGIDQVLPYPSNPVIYEPYMNDARGYITLAQSKNGPFSKPVSFEYIWGDALEELEFHKPDFRLVNLETSITASDDYWKGKGINYRMNPANIDCLLSAKVDYCALSNNHVLDWGYDGLNDTVKTLTTNKICFSGAGSNLSEAEKPAVFYSGQKRILIFSIGTVSSGIPFQWEATNDNAGVNLLHNLGLNRVESVGRMINMFRKPGDLIIVSIHWGDNWVKKIPYSHIQFAHALIDNGYADIIHGHSSHHLLAVEVYKNKAVLYGCGDFITDYEGISGLEEYRSDLSIMFLLTIDTNNGNLTEIQIVPFVKNRFTLKRVSNEDFQYINDRLNNYGQEFGNRVLSGDRKSFVLQWK